MLDSAINIVSERRLKEADPWSIMTTSFKVPVEPALIEWALARSGLKVDELVGQFHALPQWLNGEDDPTMTQLEHLAQKTHTAIGDLLLTEVPVGTVPIPDYRTVADAHLSSPSVNLLDSIYICERRQDWYRRYAINNGHEPLAFVGSLTTNTNLQTAAALVSAQLGLNEDMRRQWTTWIDARSMLVEAAERAGVLVMIRGDRRGIDES